MVYPPSATNAAPWTNDDFGEQRKRMQSAISVGVPALLKPREHLKLDTGRSRFMITKTKVFYSCLSDISYDSFVTTWTDRKR